MSELQKSHPSSVLESALASYQIGVPELHESVHKLFTPTAFFYRNKY